jgi:hypothetical protein
MRKHYWSHITEYTFWLQQTGQGGRLRLSKRKSKSRRAEKSGRWKSIYARKSNYSVLWMKIICRPFCDSRHQLRRHLAQNSLKTVSLCHLVAAASLIIVDKVCLPPPSFSLCLLAFFFHLLTFSFYTTASDVCKTKQALIEFPSEWKLFSPLK